MYGETSDYLSGDALNPFRKYASEDPIIVQGLLEQTPLSAYITSCGTTIISNGTYYLNTSLYFGKNLTAADPFDFQSCIKILTSNVTINCLGRYIVGNSTLLYNIDMIYKPMVAINVLNSKNVKISNCNIFNTTYPIRAENSQLSVSNLKTDTGVFVKNSTLIVSDSKFYGIDFEFVKSKVQECGFQPQSNNIAYNVWSEEVGGLEFPRCGRYWVLDSSADSSDYSKFPIPPHIGAAGSNVYISRTSFYGNAPSIAVHAIKNGSTIVKTSDLNVLDSLFEINYVTSVNPREPSVDPYDYASIVKTYHTTLTVTSSTIKFFGGYYLLPDPLNPIPYVPKQFMDTAYILAIYGVSAYDTTEFKDNFVHGVNIVLRGSEATVVGNIYEIFLYGGIYIPYDGNMQTSEIHHNFYGLYSCADLIEDNDGELPCPQYYVFGNEVNITNNDTITYDKSPSEICVDEDQDGICDEPFIFDVTGYQIDAEAEDTAPYSYYYLHPPLKLEAGTVTFMQVPPNFEEEIKQKILIIPRYLKVYIPPDKDYGSVEFQVINNGDRELYFYFETTNNIQDYVKSPKLGKYFYIPPNSGRKFTFIVDGYNKTESTYGSLIIYADFPEQMVKIPIRVEITREAPQEEIAWVLIPVIILLLLVAL